MEGGGGAAGAPPRPKLCKGGHRYDYWTCSACAEAKNHGEGITSRAPIHTKSRPATGRSWRQKWYDTQAKTLAKLRAEGVRDAET